MAPVPIAFLVDFDDNKLWSSFERREAFYTGLLARTERMPGVEAVGITDSVPTSDDVTAVPLLSTLPGAGTGGATVSVLMRAVDGGFFRAIGIPLLRGRLFDERDDAKGQRVAIVNEAFARRYLGSTDPVGQPMQIGRIPVTIVGAIPYPCKGPIVSSVFSTITASVPCQMSALLPMRLLWLDNMNCRTTTPTATTSWTTSIPVRMPDLEW